MVTWKGKTIWNDELLGSELLLIDDSEASTDPRARKSFGANFKESIYGGNIKINTRGKTSVDMRPVWRVLVCCNETPENLSVIPPLEEGISDKVILLKVQPISTPMPAKTVEEKKNFSAALMAELPAFLDYIEHFHTPDHLADSRDGVIAYKDPILLEAINEISPEHKLETLLAMSLKSGDFDLSTGESKFYSSADVQSLLQHRDSPSHEQAKELLRFSSNCGRYLTLLSNSKCRFVKSSKKVNGITHYEIYKTE